MSWLSAGEEMGIYNDPKFIWVSLFVDGITMVAVVTMTYVWLVMTPTTYLGSNNLKNWENRIVKIKGTMYVYVMWLDRVSCMYSWENISNSFTLFN